MKKYQCIVADPPWFFFFFDKLKMSDVPRGAAANYNTLSNADIMALPVKELADPNGAVLALWVPSSLLQVGLDVMKAWGFRHTQTYVWVKVKKEPLSNIISLLKKAYKNCSSAPFNSVIRDTLINALKKVDMNTFLAFGMGRLFRQTHEICLIGVNNNKIYKQLKNKSQRSVSFGVNLRHSAKPEHLQDSLEAMFPGTNKMEMFARRLRNGWECLGNEVCNGEDITVSLQKLM